MLVDSFAFFIIIIIILYFSNGNKFLKVKKLCQGVKEQFFLSVLLVCLFLSFFFIPYFFLIKKFSFLGEKDSGEREREIFQFMARV